MKTFTINNKVITAKEIDYGAENERTQFDTNSDIHIGEGGENNEGQDS